MRVLLSVASLRAAYGGPAVSVRGLAGALAEAGVEIGLWCPDDSAGLLNAVGQSTSLQPLTGSLAKAISAFGRPDLVHDNGLWWRHNHRIADWSWRNGVPRIVSTRGMLEPWARRHKFIRKSFAWHLYQRRDLATASALHVTSDQERKNLERVKLRTPVTAIPNGIELPDAAELVRSRDPSSRLRRALFMGRLHPVKGLADLLDAWRLVRPVDWTLLLCGPDENAHRKELETRIERLGLLGEVSFTGPVSGRLKAEQFRQADLFVLPSRSESFAMVVGEALAHAVPVLTTKNVPWPQLEDLGCGWRVEADPAGLAQGLKIATDRSCAELAGMGARGRRLVADQFAWSSVASAFRSLYADLLEDPARMRAA